MCDCDAPSAFVERRPTARKAHRCCECSRTIAPGETYVLSSGVWDGRGASFKRCLSCEAITLACRDLDEDCGPCFGELEEFIANSFGDWQELAIEYARRECARAQGSPGITMIIGADLQIS